MSEELKPCPFCDQQTAQKQYNSILRTHFVKCSTCGARSGPREENWAALEEWQDREIEQAKDQRIQELEKKIGFFVKLVRNLDADIFSIANDFRDLGDRALNDGLLALADKLEDMRPLEQAGMSEEVSLFPDDSADLALHELHTLPKAEARIAELEEALAAMRGVFDTPIARRKIQGDYANEARKLARAALKQEGADHG